MLTRESLQSGHYFDHLELPAEFRWSRDRIAQSLSATLAARPHGGDDDEDDLWLFAYGSLMWNPLLEFDRREAATLHGWHRSFSIRSLAGRGSAARPGRMLALEPGGSTQGVALRLQRSTRDRELCMVWTREMISGAYLPTWARITIAGGHEAHAIAFVANPAQPLFEPDASIDVAAPIIARAYGSLGTNAEYVFQLEAAMRECRLHDAYIASLAAELRRLNAAEA